MHLHVKARKTTLTASQFRDLHEWFEEEEARLVRKSLVRAKKLAPVFALGETCTISGEQFDLDSFENRGLKGKDLECWLGFKLRKLTADEEGELIWKRR